MQDVSDYDRKRRLEDVEYYVPVDSSNVSRDEKVSSARTSSRLIKSMNVLKEHMRKEKISPTFQQILHRTLVISYEEIETYEIVMDQQSDMIHNSLQSNKSLVATNAELVTMYESLKDELDNCKLEQNKNLKYIGELLDKCEYLQQSLDEANDRVAKYKSGLLHVPSSPVREDDSVANVSSLSDAGKSIRMRTVHGDITSQNLSTFPDSLHIYRNIYDQQYQENSSSTNIHNNLHSNYPEYALHSNYPEYNTDNHERYSVSSSTCTSNTLSNCSNCKYSEECKTMNVTIRLQASELLLLNEKYKSLQILNKHLSYLATNMTNIEDPLLNIWCITSYSKNLHRYSFVNIRDKVIHAGSYFNVTEQTGNLCMLINVVRIYGVNICINVTDPSLGNIIKSQDPHSLIHSSNNSIVNDLLKLGIQICRFRCYDIGCRYEGFLLATFYLNATVAHSSEWKFVKMM